ncbi:butyrophilin subfamily 3 member A2 [Pseudoliparis swirei]|uniref:butyrophilin subfamily 3 member A2 n=1 Tax=Pseudoliparis swirei TaxID=2059687 RepID=UPI0024BDF450|nr:butyrophilin subfamily 3 member A2 [Pseudoliparis swirei]
MRTYLGVFVLVLVSGDDTTILGVLEDSVLLPCTCLELDKEFKFKWQMEEPNPMLIYKHNKTLSNRFKDRVKIFLTENNDNCSVLLTNITAEDQGRYKCIFRRGDTYQKSNIYLNVSASFILCQTKNSLSGGGVKVFQCNVTGRYREARIQWTLHGRPLTDLTETRITHTNNTDALDGLYHFNSTLSTRLNWTSEPRCDVKANNISTLLSSGCGVRTEKIVGNSNRLQQVRVWLKIIHVMMFGLTLLLLLLFSKRSPSTQEVNTNNL